LKVSDNIKLAVGEMILRIFVLILAGPMALLLLRLLIILKISSGVVGVNIECKLLFVFVLLDFKWSLKSLFDGLIFF